MEEKTMFDDWSDVKDCNDCTHYWNDGCDGVVKGSKKPCNGFLATRRVDALEEIKSLRTHLKWLNVALILQGIALVLHLLSHILGWV